MKTGPAAAAAHSHSANYNWAKASSKTLGVCVFAQSIVATKFAAVIKNSNSTPAVLQG